MEHAELIRNYIVDNFLFGEDDSLTEDTSFLENGIVDSTGIMELVAFVEESYDCKVEDEDLVPENFDSIRNIVRYIERQRNGNHGG